MSGFSNNSTGNSTEISGGTPNTDTFNGSCTVERLQEKEAMNTGPSSLGSHSATLGSVKSFPFSSSASEFVPQSHRSFTAVESSSIIESSRCYSHFPSIMVVLFGLPGSGKTTFSTELCQCSSMKESQGRHFTWICQDLFGNRKQCQVEAERALSFGSSVIIDRCNQDESQRKHWLDLAAQYGVPAICVSLPQSRNAEICIQNATRRGLDYLHDKPTDWNSVVRMIESQSTNPHINEGFYEVIRLGSQRDIDEIIDKLSVFGGNS
jgi:hypothetical protein